MPRLLLCYHFFHPDDVISARMFSDLAVEQHRRGWEVDVLTSNRTWQNPHARLAARESWQGVRIHRLFRPPWDQARPVQRLANSAWMIDAYLARALTLGPFDAAVIGSDPAFAPLLALGLRLARPRAALVHWCFDLYPEAIVAESATGARAALAPAARRMMAAAYRRFDALVDIGPRMRERLAAYGAPARQETLVPWALHEPDAPAPVDEAERRALFPDAKLALLYSGTMGRAHDFDLFLHLARVCRLRAGNAVTLCFAARGNRIAELRAAIRDDDSNVRFAAFADERTLAARLAAADLHLISLRDDWAGVVVPSKFFASLAIGRPVIYAGPADSEIARWVQERDLGLHLTAQNMDATADRLIAIANDPATLARQRANAHAVYQHDWSKRVTNDGWDRLLRALCRVHGD